MVEAIPLQIVVEPAWDIAAPSPHEIYLVLCNGDGIQRLDLSGQFPGEPLGIDRIVSVGERVFDLGTREIVNHRTAHRELIEVIICEMGYYLFHIHFNIKKHRLGVRSPERCGI